MLMVGRLGATSIAAVGLGMQVLFMVMPVMAAIGIGTTALVARFIGAQSKDDAEEILTQSILFPSPYLSLSYFLGFI
jgi:Na+-driven multidrug efflux pump